MEILRCKNYWNSNWNRFCRSLIRNTAPLFKGNLTLNTKVDESESEEEETEEEFRIEYEREFKKFKIIQKNLHEDPPRFTDKSEKKLFESDRESKSQMEFWSSKFKELPILANLALSFGSIPTSTSIVESSFLHANNIKKDDRNRLSQKHTEQQLLVYYEKKLNH